MEQFSSKKDAFDWMEEAVSDPCVDNHRFAFVDDAEATEKFNEQCEDGCCGSFNEKILVNGKEALIGCNYGH